MIRPFTFVCALLAAASGLYLYQSKHDGQMQNRDIQNLLEEADKYRQQAVVVATEYQLESNPDRLTELANRFLTGLKPNQPTQFATLADLDQRLPPAGPPLPSPPWPPEPQTVFDYPRPPSAPLPVVVEPSSAPMAQAEAARLVASAKPASPELPARPPQLALASGGAKPLVVVPEQASPRSAPPPQPASPLPSPSLIVAAAAATWPSASPPMPSAPPRATPRIDAPLPLARDPGAAPLQTAESMRAPQASSPPPQPARVAAIPRPVQYAARPSVPSVAPISAPMATPGPMFGGVAAPPAPAPSALGMARSMVYQPPRYPTYQTTGSIGNGS